MKFRTELILPESNINISYANKLLLLGSCFSDNIGRKLERLKYQTNINPLGIVYHPIPLHNSIVNAIKGSKIKTSDLNKSIDGQYTSWNIHSRFNHQEQSVALDQMNTGISILNKSVIEADYLFLTYGTAYCYTHNQFGPVANCHKFPAKSFEKSLSTPETLVNSFEQMLTTVREINPKIKVMLTVSPVRHIKDGIIENNRSKAHLLSAVHTLCDMYDNCIYLPSYELLIDDLRDYRYYADDMVHPTAKAIDYIWSKISEYMLDPSEENLRSEILKIVRAANHRPFDAHSEKHLQFLSNQANAVNSVLALYPDLDFSNEMSVFNP